MPGRTNSQSGLLFEGLAITRPDAAPETQEPVEPILQRRFCRAIGLSLARKESAERLIISASRAMRLGPGAAKMACTTQVAATRSENECMMCWVIIAVVLKRLLVVSGKKRGLCRRSIVALYSSRPGLLKPKTRCCQSKADDTALSLNIP